VSALLRHRPVVLADDGDRFLEGVELYGVEVGRWLQYWIGWPGDRDHAGTDWEMGMALRADASDEVLSVVLAQHRTARLRPWRDVARDPDDPDRFVIYAGRDKHASYFDRGVLGYHRHGRHLERTNGRVRLDLPLHLELPVAVADRLAHRDPDAWFAKVRLRKLA
jgi:hypothetical protein